MSDDTLDAVASKVKYTLWTSESAKRALLAGALFLMALLATLSYGKGNILGEGVNDLHIDPIGFIHDMLFTWEPRSALGSHNGFTQVYLTPYSLLYALFAEAHVSAEIAQRLVLFLIYLWIAVGMYWALGGIDAHINRAGRLAGAAAYLFNIYVAFNSAGSVPMLLTYASLPCIVAALGAALDARWSIVRSSVAIALFVFAGSGINPPLIAINLIVILVYVLSYLAWHAATKTLWLRLAAIGCGATVATIAVNLYWIVPFLDYMRTAWIGGVLDESPMMHNADSSFANVFRGLGQWSIFASGGGQAYYPWAHPYEPGQLFSVLLWLVPICGAAGLLFRGAKYRSLPFFLATAFVAVPLAVGYYHGPIGDAITEPIYNFLYNSVPGFQMFRSAYKWVGAYEFGAAGLFAVFASSLYLALKERARRLVPAAFAVAALPLILYVPVIINQANYPMNPIPSWSKAEDRLVGSSKDSRVALFPSQYLEQFLWGSPGYYMEHSLIHKPLSAGYLGAATNEAADRWLRLAYRRARQGDSRATDLFRLISVSEILQRDDFRSDQDFAFPGQIVTSNATISHDILTRVMGLRETGRDAANRLYAVPDYLPLVYGVSHPEIATVPAVGVPSTSNAADLAKGEVQVSLDGLDISGISALLASGAVAGTLPSTIDDYATTLLMPQSTHIEVQIPHQRFIINRGGRYRVVAMNLGFDYRYPLRNLRIDGKTIKPRQPFLASWQYLGTVSFSEGAHYASSSSAGYLTPVLMAFESEQKWERNRTALQELLQSRVSSQQTMPVKSRRGRFFVNRAGMYSLQATPMYPDDLYHTRAVGDLSAAPLALRVAASANVQTYALPYVPAAGVSPTAPHALPEGWYEIPGVYDWNRGAAVDWWLLARNAKFVVFSPASKPIRATLAMRFSALAPIDRLKISYPGGSTQVTVHGQSLPASTTPAQPLVAMIRPPQQVVAPIVLQPGLTTLEISGAPAVPTLPNDAVSDALLAQAGGYVGAITVSMAINTRDSAAKSYIFPQSMRLRTQAFPGGVLAIYNRNAKDTFSVAGFRLPDRTLDGNPFLQGHIVPVSGTMPHIWIATEISLQGRSRYRILPLSDPNNFNMSLSETLANTESDVGATVLGTWLIMSPSADETGRESSVLSVSSTGVTRTAMASALYGSSTLAHVDGQATGKAVHLAAGSHNIEGVGPSSGVDTLTVTRGTIKTPQRLPLRVHFVSPVEIQIVVPSGAKPFLLVLNESYYPQWQAFLGKHQLKHVQANGFANGWIVPAVKSGTKIRVLFSSQRIFVIASRLSCGAIAAGILLLVFGGWKRRRT